MNARDGIVYPFATAVSRYPWNITTINNVNVKPSAEWIGGEYVFEQVKHDLNIDVECVQSAWNVDEWMNAVEMFIV